MAYGYRRKVSNPCIICRERAGSIHTRDGMVCDACMPRELLGQAGRLGIDRIILYTRTHADWVSCEAPEETCEGPTVSGDRSMAITLDDPIVLADELNSQIATAGSIDMVVSFIKMSGLNLLIDSLRDFTRRGRLRVITTAYMGATEYDALEELFSLPNTEVRMELDAESSRLHAKSFIFNRDGTGTAYVGSANISKTALTSGEEWVVKLREQDVPMVMDDLRRGYEALWKSGHLKPVCSDNRAEIETALEKRGL